MHPQRSIPSVEISTSVSSATSSLSLGEEEAAVALAHLAMTTESGSGSSFGRNDGVKRVKSELPPHSVSNVVADCISACSDPASDRGIVDQQQHQLECRNPGISFLDVLGKDSDVSKPSVACPRSYPSYCGGRSRQNLTEAEKEARRLRRIMANRESARETIRRRQALLEELQRKVADLASEKEKLKQEKELATREFQSQEATNKMLKMNQIIKVEKEESEVEPNPTHLEMPMNTGGSCPVLYYNQHPLPSFCWHSVAQSLDAVQPRQGLETGMHCPRKLAMPTNEKPDKSQQQLEGIIYDTGPSAPMYIAPCPWLFPVLEVGKRINPQPHFASACTHDATSSHNQGTDGPSSKTAVKSKSAGPSKIVVVNDLNQTPVGSPTSVGRPDNKESIVPSSVVKETQLPQFVPVVDSVYMKASQSTGKKIAEVTTAADSRKRRMELTKLKAIHGRQSQTND